MQISKTILTVAFALFSGVSAMAQSTMTDQQVLDYGKQGMAAGKDVKTIGRELMAKGVTREQAERVKKLYESQQGETLSSTPQTLPRLPHSSTLV